MKKTLATLLCMSMMASADTLTQDFLVSKDGSGATAYTFDFAIEDADSLNDGTVLALLYFTFADSNDLVNGLKFQVDSSSQAITLLAGQGAMSRAWNGSDPEISSSTVFTQGTAADRSAIFRDTDGAGVTLSRNIAYRIDATKGTYDTHQDWQILNLSQINVDGTTTVLGTAAFNGNVNGGGGATYMKSLFNASFATPEPATATLSLLALAGLASRRRRH